MVDDGYTRQEAATHVHVRDGGILGGDGDGER